MYAYLYICLYTCLCVTAAGQANRVVKGMKECMIATNNPGSDRLIEARFFTPGVHDGEEAGGVGGTAAGFGVG